MGGGFVERSEKLQRRQSYDGLSIITEFEPWQVSFEVMHLNRESAPTFFPVNGEVVARSECYTLLL